MRTRWKIDWLFKVIETYWASYRLFNQHCHFAVVYLFGRDKNYLVEVFDHIFFTSSHFHFAVGYGRCRHFCVKNLLAINEFYFTKTQKISPQTGVFKRGIKNGM